MTTPRPNALRYIQCELPSEVEQLLIKFDDEMTADFQEFENRLDDFIANTMPPIQDALDQQAAIRDEILAGSPTPELSSLEAMEKNLKLTSPAHRTSDAATVRLDERKLGAVGIALINGNMYRKVDALGLNGEGRLDVLRYLWEAVSGDYEAFLVLGDGIVATNTGEFTLVEPHLFKTNFPYINRSVLDLTKNGDDISQFRLRLVWNESVAHTPANFGKLKGLGYSDAQITNIFSYKRPNDPFDKESRLGAIQLDVKRFTRLLLLPDVDPERQPRWQNEFTIMVRILKSFLQYRFDKNLTNSVLDPAYWEKVKFNLTEPELREILENRPELHEIEVPTSIATISAIINAALTVPAGSSVFNSYMIKIQDDAQKDKVLENRIYNLGFMFWRQLVRAKMVTEANIINGLLAQISGKPAFSVSDPVNIVDPPTGGDDTKPTLPTPAKLKEIFDTDDTDGNIGNLASDSVKTSDDPDLTTQAMVTDSELNSQKQSPKATVGLSTQETTCSLLARLVKNWSGSRECGATDKTTKNNMEDHIFDPTPSPVLPTNDDLSGDSQRVKDALGRIQEVKHKSNPKSFGPAQVDPSKNIINIPNHRYRLDAHVEFEPAPGSTLPSGIKANERYYIINPNDHLSVPKDFFAISADIGGKPVPLYDNGKGTMKVYQIITQSRAKNRKQIQAAQAQPRAKVKTEFNITCKDPFDNALTRKLSELEGKFRAAIIRICNILKQIILDLQNKIDTLIAKIQVIIDAVLARLERLLTFDFHLGGKIGFENSIIKCSWGIDFNIKFDLFGILLRTINEFFKPFGKSIRDALNFLTEMITKIICVPVRILETILGAANALLGLIGCSLKDVNLPTEILDLLKLLLFSFDIRSLVIRKGYEAFNGMNWKFKRGNQAFRGLAQFGALCNKPSVTAAMNALDSALLLAVPNVTKSANLMGKAIDKALQGSIGAVI